MKTRSGMQVCVHVGLVDVSSQIHGYELLFCVPCHTCILNIVIAPSQSLYMCTLHVYRVRAGMCICAKAVDLKSSSYEFSYLTNSTRFTY